MIYAKTIFGQKFVNNKKGKGKEKENSFLK